MSYVAGNTCPGNWLTSIYFGSRVVVSAMAVGMAVVIATAAKKNWIDLDADSGDKRMGLEVVSRPSRKSRETTVVAMAIATTAKMT
jgi:hypothetical protein